MEVAGRSEDDATTVSRIICDMINQVEQPGEKIVLAQVRKKSYGGITCCVPLCYNNNLRNRDLSFYCIPSQAKYPDLRKKWLSAISRKDEKGKNFVPSRYHRVCSAHFAGGKKTYMNNVPTIVPKTLRPSEKRKRLTANSSGCRNSEISAMTPIIQSELIGHPCTQQNDPTQQELLENEIVKLKQANKSLEEIIQGKNEELLEKDAIIAKNKFCIDRFKHNREHFKFYTGFESYEQFMCVLEYLQPASSLLTYWDSKRKLNIENIEPSGGKRAGRVRSLRPDDEFFMVMTRLRCALPIMDLHIRFHMSTTNISRILVTWYDFLHSQFRMLPIWASKKYILDTMPKQFREAYPYTRVILDCTELFIEMPTSARSQSATFSSYKHHNTAKGLVGIAPNGLITFVSDLYTGRISDKKITSNSGIYDLLENGDSIMADRGFDLDDDLPAGVSLNIPPFLDGKPQLSVEEEIETRRIASLRVHVERAIERVKNFKILQNVFPLSMAADLNKIWVICCYLVNFLPPLISDKE